MLDFDCFPYFVLISETMTAGSINILGPKMEGAKSNTHMVFQLKIIKTYSNACLFLLFLLSNDFTNYDSRLRQHTVPFCGRCREQYPYCLSVK